MQACIPVGLCGVAWGWILKAQEGPLNERRTQNCVLFISGILDAGLAKGTGVTHPLSIILAQSEGFVLGLPKCPTRYLDLGCVQRKLA